MSAIQSDKWWFAENADGSYAIGSGDFEHGTVKVREYAERIVACVNEHEDVLRVVLAAWDVIEHREDEFDDPSTTYGVLQTALEQLASRGKK